jgi:hypothetical protein
VEIQLDYFFGNPPPTRRVAHDLLPPAVFLTTARTGLCPPVRIRFPSIGQKIPSDLSVDDRGPSDCCEAEEKVNRSSTSALKIRKFRRKKPECRRSAVPSPQRGSGNAQAISRRSPRQQNPDTTRRCVRLELSLLWLFAGRSARQRTCRPARRLAGERGPVRSRQFGSHLLEVEPRGDSRACLWPHAFQRGIRI